MQKKIESLQYQENDWDVLLPTVEAYNFMPAEISDFIHGSRIAPYVFDTNLIRNCNVSCKYCSTFGGKSDLRYHELENLPLLDDDDIEKLIPELATSGVKTILLCSNGEPLLNLKSFLRISSISQHYGLKVVTYTNGSTLNKKNLKQLLLNGVNLIIKLESLSPTLNTEIIASKKGYFKSTSFKHKYAKLNGSFIPVNIIDAFDVYAGNEKMLGLETMISKDNIAEILDLRCWVYDNLKVAHFLKKLYPLGYTKLFGYQIKPIERDECIISKKIEDLDSSFGFKYPAIDLPDEFSFDVRRFINNVTNSKGTAFRMFAHERGGVYHSSQIVKKKFGFGTENIIPILFSENKLMISSYFSKIQEIINN